MPAQNKGDRVLRLWLFQGFAVMNTNKIKAFMLAASVLFLLACGEPQSSDTADAGPAALTVVETMLANMGVLKQPDGLALQQLVSIWAEWHKYDQYLQNNPDTLEVLDNNGMIREIKLHPYVKQRSKCSDQLDKHLANFGLTPSSRSRISLDPKDKKKKTGKIT